MPSEAAIDYAGRKKIYSKQEIDDIVAVLNASIDNKPCVPQYEQLPSPMEFAGKIVQYSGLSNLNFKNGRFYCSNGVDWFEIQVSAALIVCTSLPIWDAASPDTMYFVTNEDKCYVKDTEHYGQWYTVAGSTGKPFAIVFEMPSWSDASVNKIYLLATVGSSRVSAWVKNPLVQDAWYRIDGGGGSGGVTDYNELDNTPTINGLETKTTAGSTKDVKLEAIVKEYDNEGVYDTTGVSVPVNELSFEAYTEAEIAQAFNEA